MQYINIERKKANGTTIKEQLDNIESIDLVFENCSYMTIPSDKALSMKVTIDESETLDCYHFDEQHRLSYIEITDLKLLLSKRANCRYMGFDAPSIKVKNFERLKYRDITQIKITYFDFDTYEMRTMTLAVPYEDDSMNVLISENEYQTNTLIRDGSFLIEINSDNSKVNNDRPKSKLRIAKSR